MGSGLHLNLICFQEDEIMIKASDNGKNDLVFGFKNSIKLNIQFKKYKSMSIYMMLFN